MPTLTPGIRIPGLGITLPRLVIGLIIAFITSLGWAGDATVLRAVSPGIDAAPVALMQLWPAMIIFVIAFTIFRRTWTLGSPVHTGSVGQFPAPPVKG